MTRAKNRPFGVTVIALLLLINGLIALVQGSTQLIELYQERAGLSEPILLDDLAEATEDWTARDWLTVPFTISGIILAWGMLTLHPRAWLATMALQAIYLVIHLYDYFEGEARTLSLVITLATVFYLNLSDVQLAFRSAPPVAGKTTTP
ncbi:MAG: hypothetical protein GX613_15435 [Chloroflexi bacterium]|nr:hypothetical protein [Chloroflexota bacterium]